MIDSMQEFMSRDRSPKWLIDGIVQRDALTMLFGESGIGKSFAALDWALCVATGREWMGRAVTQGPVIYLPSEGHEGLQARILAWCAARGIAEEEIAEIPLNIASYSMSVGEETEALLEEIKFVRPKPILIVIDTLTGWSVGMDQNSSKDMAELASSCERIKLETDATILVVHHSGHKEKGRSKGAVDFWAACDAVVGMVRVGRAGTLALRCNKSRNRAPFEDIHVRLEAREPSAVLVECMKPAEGENTALSKGDRIFREIVSGAPIAEPDARTRFCEAYGGTAGANRNAWSRALKKAVNAGLIEFEEETGELCAQAHD